MRQYLPLLRQSAIFSGTENEEILAMLNCLQAVKREYPKEHHVFRSGDSIQSMGLVLSGHLMLFQEDLWGHRNIMAKIAPGEVFAEAFASSPNTPVNLSAIAETACTILWLDVAKLLHTCPSACTHHEKIVRNLVAVLARKNLRFNEKITHISKRTTREKLLSFLSSESMRNGSLSFDIHYDRQQLADYLCVERAAMSVELSKLQRDGILTYRKNHFTLFADPKETV